ncbi:MAG TPA: glycosyltransferase family 1 protein [Acidimicrobiales bacterium]|nr:glycosyltransferase family 1 protein [Acidimicrobiales bacterium]
MRRHPAPAEPTPQATAEVLSVSIDVSAVPERPAGAGYYTLELVRALERAGAASLTLVTRRGDALRWSTLAPGARLMEAAPRPRPARLAWEQLAMPRLLAAAGVGVHHSPHYTMPERSNLPRVVTIHDVTFFDHPEWHERAKVPVFRRAIRLAARRADALVCVSSVTAGRLEALLAPEAPVIVVPHGVDHERFRPEEPEPGADAAALAALGVVEPYVAFVGTAEPRKGVTTLVRAFDRMCSAHRGLSLVLAGGHGWSGGPLQEALSSMKHPDRIVRTGYVPDAAVPALLRRAAAVAYPALEEGFGLPVLEALACAAPVVTTSGTAMEEVAGPAALLVPPGDAGALAGALDMLVRGDAGLASRRSRGLALAAGYTWEASAAGHMRAYRTAVEARR